MPPTKPECDVVLPPLSPTQRVGMGDVARKIRGRTTDFLAMTLVVAASLSFGSQIISWWKGPNTSAVEIDVAESAQPGWETAGEPVEFDFGDLPVSLTRQTITGDYSQAVAILVERCQEWVANGVIPDDEPDAAERELLKKISEVSPTKASGNWQVYVIGEDIPFVVGVIERSLPRVDSAGAEHDKQFERRLVCYGLAMPVGEENWTAFVVQKRSSANAERKIEMPVIGDASELLPPGSSLTMSLRDIRGGGLYAFAGSGTLAEWMEFYEKLSSKNDWPRNGIWSHAGSAWGTRYSCGARRWIDVRFAMDRRGVLTGMLQIVPGELALESKTRR